MKLIARKNEGHAKVALLTAGVLSLLPLLNPTSAQAKPKDHAPAWGYRDKEDRRDDRHGRWEDRGKNKNKNKNKHDSQGDWRGNRDDDRNHNHDDDCDHRGHNGNHGYPDYGYPGGYNGSYPGGYNSPANQSFEFDATVLRVYSVYRLDVRGDNGQSYAVSSNDDFSTKINPGDRVRVTASSTGGNAILAKKVKLIDDRVSGNNGNYGTGSSVNFGGRVDSVRADRGVVTLGVRGDNGQRYTVRYNSNAYFRVGDRVRIVGNYSNGVVNASSVSR